MRSPKNRWLVLLATVSAFFPVVVDMTILHIAIPSLTLALKADGLEILWIIDVYPLMMAGLLAPMGTLADKVGPRRVLLWGLAIFGAASIAAAFSPSAMALIASRAVLAVGASMIMPSVLAVVRLSFDDGRERAMALGIWSAVASGGAALGPLIGGLILEHFWWGAAFLVNAPIMALCFPVVFLLIPDLEGNRGAKWEIGQALILIIGLMVLVYGVKGVARPGASAAEIAACVGAGLALLFWFGSMQLRDSNPMLDLSLFGKKAIAVGLLMAFFSTAALAGFELLLALELQYVLERTPLEAGLFMLPLMAASVVAGPLSGALTERLGLRAVAFWGMLASGGSLALLGQLDFNGNPYGIGALLAVLGFALGASLLASSVAIMGAAPPERAGAVGSLESMGYELGAGVGVTFFGLLLAVLYHDAFIQLSGVSGAASESIGEALGVARDIGGAQGESIAHAARQAFASSHGVVLSLAGGSFALLSVVVYALLGESAGRPGAHRHE